MRHRFCLAWIIESALIIVLLTVVLLTVVLTGLRTGSSGVPEERGNEVFLDNEYDAEQHKYK